jgi:hypothetical protein
MGYWSCFSSLVEHNTCEIRCLLAPPSRRKHKDLNDMDQLACDLDCLVIGKDMKALLTMT